MNQKQKIQINAQQQQQTDRNLFKILFDPIPSSFSPSHITKYIIEKIKQSNNQPWKLLNNVNELITQIINHLTSESSQQTHSTYECAKGYSNDSQNSQGKYQFSCKGMVYMQNQEQIYIGKGTVIEHGTSIVGPCIIGPNCQIRKGAYVRGNVIIGEKSLIGNSCELKNAILMDNCQIAHFNYIGDSILGIHAHFSAGAITSNYKLDGSLIKVVMNASNEHIKTDRNKLGALVGHNVEIGCNAILNPGSIIGQNSVVYPLVNWRGSLPANRICKLAQQHKIVQRK